MGRKAPGKYDGVLHKLTKLVSTESPAYQDRVEQKKDELRTMLDTGEKPAVNLAKHYRVIRMKIDVIKAELSAANLELAACVQLLIDTQERGEQGWGEYGASPNMMRLITGDTLRVDPEPYTVAEDKDAIRNYFIAAKMERLLTPSWQTLNSLNKERLLNGEPELPGTKLYIKTGITFTPMKTEGASSEAEFQTEGDL